jgi:EAL domain-containing protein (putative c-di-GMP-specific phosphodiesterase class I)/GGDEF domain-containing protein
MTEHLPWDDALSRLEYAFQPIVNARTGACYGYEALLRGWEGAGFTSIRGLFDSAFDEELLHVVELALREKAIARFVELPHHRSTRLFYNLDSRVLNMPDYEAGRTLQILADHGLQSCDMCLEISERHDVSGSTGVLAALERYRSQGFSMAIDDYGSGFSGLQLLYHSHPDLIKIDRFFVGGIERDSRKRLFVANTITMAHLMGVRVVCEGIETAQELRVCQELGSDLAQGYYVQVPTTNTSELLSAYPGACVSQSADRQDPDVAAMLVIASSRPTPVTLSTPMPEVLARFHDDPRVTFLVVVDGRGEPVGILREESIKPFVFSTYGWALLSGPSAPDIATYITRCPLAEVHTPIGQLSGLFSHAEESEDGILLTDNGLYAGFVSTAQLVRAIHGREVAAAREQNPLTGLPGNSRIEAYLQESLGDWSRGYVFVYFDFDGFKAFNDTYGFQQGDRAIRLFAKSLQLAARDGDWFVGHIGGDDFFVGMRTGYDGFDGAIRRTNDLIQDFAIAVRDLYPGDDLLQGGVLPALRERDGDGSRSFLGVSAGIVHAPRGRSRATVEGLTSLIATLKTSAKRSASHIATLEYDQETPSQANEGRVGDARRTEPPRPNADRPAR